jgi:hypothetical protein
MTIKLFLKKISLFFSISILGLILISFLLNFKNKALLNNYKVPGNVNTLFIGDSHIMQGINDSMIPNSINLSLNSESYYYSYYKIKAIVTNNPSIKNIFLGFSYHCLSSYYEDQEFGKYSKDVSTTYFFIMPFSEQIRLIAVNYSELPAFFRNMLIKGLYPSYLGKYQNDFKRTCAQDSSMDKRILFQFYKSGNVTQFSTINLYYLNKIVTYCRHQKINLTLLNTPEHTYYKKKIPLQFINKYNQVVSKYRIPVIDFHELDLSDSCFIPDGDHVSEKGAMIISKKLKELLN